MSDCQARQYHDQWRCDACGLTWDADDPEPPECPRQTSASWVIKRKDTGAVVCETFSAAAVEALDTSRFEAVPIMDYLQGVARAARLPDERY